MRIGYRQLCPTQKRLTDILKSQGISASITEFVCLEAGEQVEHLMVQVGPLIPVDLIYSAVETVYANKAVRVHLTRNLDILSQMFNRVRWYVSSSSQAVGAGCFVWTEERQAPLLRAVK